MTIIDRKAGISYPGMKVRQAAAMVGVAQITVYRWKKRGIIQEFNHFLIVFHEVNDKNA